MTDSRQFRMNTPKVIHQLIDGEAVLIHLDRGFYFSMDAVGALVLQVLEQQGSVDQMVSAVQARYAGEAAGIRADVVRLTDELVEEDIVIPLAVAAEIAVMEALTLPMGDSGRLPYFVPRLEKFTDLQELLLLDPIHEVDETGWPSRKA